MNNKNIKFLNSKSSIEYWINDKGLEKVETSKYWNDEEIEKDKEFYSIDINDMKAINYIHKSGLEEIFKNAINIVQKEGNKISGKVLDIAAGVGFTSAIISKYENVSKVFCLDISEHRLEKIAPIIFRQYNAEEEKINRIVGSFYDLKIDDNSIDLVIMSQAFHHSLEPKRMLLEINRVLKKTGFIIITGEKIITYKNYSFRLIKKIIRDILIILHLREKPDNYRLLSYQFRDVFPSSRVKGDTHYTLKMVKNIFQGAGFVFKYFSINLSVNKNKREYIYLLKRSI